MKEQKKESGEEALLRKIGIVLWKIIRTFLLLVMFLLLWMGIPEAAIFGGAVLVLYYFFHLRKKAKMRYEKLQGGFSEFAGKTMTETDWVRVMVLEELQRYCRVGLVPAEEKTRKKRFIATAVYLTAVFALLMSCYYRLSVIGWLTVLTVAYMAVYFRIHPVEELCRDVREQPDRAFGEIVGRKMTETPPKPRILLGIAAGILVLGVFIGVNRTERLTFAPTQGGVCLTSCRPGLGGFSQTVTIAETYNGQPVVAIGKRAFAHNQLMETVHLPDTVTTIDSYAFKGCKSLTEIQLPEGLTTLNGESFKNCVSLKEITIPTGVTEIRGNTFENCEALENVVLHDGIVDIHAYAFRNCKSLKNIDLPTGITEIKAYTFENCKALESVYIPQGVVSVRAHAFYGCSSLRYVYVPDSVQEIRSSAFRSCTALKSIEIPKGTAVDERAFKDSPTKVTTKLFTDDQISQINEEVQEKQNTVKVYYRICREDRPDEVLINEDGLVSLVDDPRYAQRLPEGQTLLALETSQQRSAFLRKAQADGAVRVKVVVYSQIGTEIVGRDHFISYTKSVEDALKTFAP